MHIQFTKMTGAGNDFVVIDNRSKQIRDGSGLARRLCDRRWGIGADGLLLLEPSSLADYAMMYFNADGSYGGMCGNGGRCIAAFAKDRGLASPLHSFEALDHIYKVSVLGELVELSMKDPANIQMNIMLPIAGKRSVSHFVDTGSPHIVVLLKRKNELENFPVESLGRKIRNLKRFRPEGTNVNFVEIDDDKSLSMRTYERGVESETLACGTGAIAAAVIAYKLGRLRPPVGIKPRSGEILSVNFEDQAGIRNVVLKGAARIVFQGSIDL